MHCSIDILGRAALFWREIEEELSWGRGEGDRDKEERRETVVSIKYI